MRAPELEPIYEMKGKRCRSYPILQVTLRRCIPAERRYPTWCRKDKAEKKQKSNF